MFSCFVAGSKRWIQLLSRVITCSITSGSFSIHFRHLRQTSILWSLCTCIRKWGTQQAATLCISISHAELYGQMILKYPELEWVVKQWYVTIFSNYSCDYIHHLLGVNAQWSSSKGEKCSGFSAFGEGLKCEQRLSNLQAIPHLSMLLASTSQFLLQISLTNKKFLSDFFVYFSNPLSLVQISVRVTKTTFTKIVVTRQWKVVTRCNFNHWRRIDHRSRSAVWLRIAVGNFAIQSELSSYFWTILLHARITKIHNCVFLNIILNLVKKF